MAETWRNWKIKRRLGQGGQAVTHLVRSIAAKPAGDHVLKRYRRRPNATYRAENEIKATTTLEHPNLIRVVDHNLDGDEIGLVSEFCEQGPLTQAHRERLVSDLGWLSVFRQICDGLAHAHEEGIVHRDIKPANILLKRGDVPAVCDFGICYVPGEERGTETHEHVGPWYFIAPELAQGRLDSVTPRSDVYSLGKLLYWFRTGKYLEREFHRDKRYDFLEGSKTPLDYFLYRILDKTVQYAPSDRLADAGQMAAEIASVERLILMNAHCIGKDIPQHCSYCGIGMYVRSIDPFTQNSRAALRSALNLSEPGDMDTMVQVCNHCGHVAIFRMHPTSTIAKNWQKQ